MGGSELELRSEEAASVACWAYLEEGRTPWWRLLRRRWLQRVFSEYAALHDRLRTEAEESHGYALGPDNEG